MPHQPDPRIPDPGKSADNGSTDDEGGTDGETDGFTRFYANWARRGGAPRDQGGRGSRSGR